MCPFSQLTRLWLIFAILLVLMQFVVCQVRNSWAITCDPESPTVHMDEIAYVVCNVTGAEDDDRYSLQLQSVDTGILTVNEDTFIISSSPEFSFANISMTGNFLGRTKVSLKVRKDDQDFYEDSMDVTVIRRKRPIDTVFTASVATLVAIIYINFGCALKWPELKTSLKRPIGPIIGFISQFLFMPLLSFGLGKVLFPDNTDMQLGMFFTGVAPAGGASNMWAVILGGNLNLSITMTTISNIAAFAMMPLWLFTLGRQIFVNSDIAVPYAQISMYALALVVPLFIGYLMQRYLKKIAGFLARILKGFSSLLLIFIIVFAIATNLYLFKLFSWQILVSGLGLPWLAYIFGWLFAKICRQSPKDALTIAIEAGIQNTGISIFLLRLTLPQPQADITTVVPVAVATMTPIPLLLLFVVQKLRKRYCDHEQEKKEKIMNENDEDFQIEQTKNEY